MSKPACRKGDKCTGHGDAPPRASLTGSDNVFYNSKAAHRKDDKWAIHKGHDSTLANGSSTVFINSKPAGRKGDPIKCGSKVNEGSPNIFISD